MYNHHKCYQYVFNFSPFDEKDANFEAYIGRYPQSKKLYDRFRAELARLRITIGKRTEQLNECALLIDSLKAGATKAAMGYAELLREMISCNTTVDVRRYQNLLWQCLKPAYDNSRKEFLKPPFLRKTENKLSIVSQEQMAFTGQTA